MLIKEHIAAFLPEALNAITDGEDPKDWLDNLSVQRGWQFKMTASPQTGD